MRLQIITGIFFIIIGCTVFRIHTDQEFINLTPSEGSGLLVVIKSDSVFEQTFAVRAQTISKIGAYFMPIHVNTKTSNGNIHVELIQHGTVQASGNIPVFQIDNESASLIRVTPPLATTRGEFLTMRITTSPDATGLVALRKRMFDESFPNRDISFKINGVAEQYPVAYQVMESLWPPFTAQAGGIFVITGVLLLAWNVIKKAKNSSTILALLAIVALHTIPSYKTHPIFVPLISVLLIATWVMFRISGRTILASAFGAFIFACSTWLPLHIITGGDIVGILSVRDALIDPNQISVSHGAGGYVGIPAVLFTFAGLLIWFIAICKKRFVAFQIDTYMVVLFALSMIITFMRSPMQTPRAIIIVVFCIAWFASLAFDRMQRFLGLRDIFIQALMTLLLAISLLDFMHITARTFTYGLGI